MMKSKVILFSVLLFCSKFSDSVPHSEDLIRQRAHPLSDWQVDSNAPNDQYLDTDFTHTRNENTLRNSAIQQEDIYENEGRYNYDSYEYERNPTSPSSEKELLSNFDSTTDEHRLDSYRPRLESYASRASQVDSDNQQYKIHNWRSLNQNANSAPSTVLIPDSERPLVTTVQEPYRGPVQYLQPKYIPSSNRRYYQNRLAWIPIREQYRYPLADNSGDNEYVVNSLPRFATIGPVPYEDNSEEQARTSEIKASPSRSQRHVQNVASQSGIIYNEAPAVVVTDPLAEQIDNIKYNSGDNTHVVNNPSRFRSSGPVPYDNYGKIQATPSEIKARPIGSRRYVKNFEPQSGIIYNETPAVVATDTLAEQFENIKYNSGDNTHVVNNPSRFRSRGPVTYDNYGKKQATPSEIKVGPIGSRRYANNFEPQSGIMNNKAPAVVAKDTLMDQSENIKYVDNYRLRSDLIKTAPITQYDDGSPAISSTVNTKNGAPADITKYLSEKPLVRRHEKNYRSDSEWSNNARGDTYYVAPVLLENVEAKSGKYESNYGSDYGTKEYDRAPPARTNIVLVNAANNQYKDSNVPQYELNSPDPLNTNPSQDVYHLSSGIKEYNLHTNKNILAATKKRYVVVIHPNGTVEYVDRHNLDSHHNSKIPLVVSDGTLAIQSPANVPNTIAKTPVPVDEYLLPKNNQPADKIYSNWFPQFEDFPADRSNVKPLPVYTKQPADNNMSKTLFPFVNEPAADESSKPLPQDVSEPDNATYSKWLPQHLRHVQLKPKHAYVNQPGDGNNSKLLPTYTNMPEDGKDLKSMPPHKKQPGDPNKSKSKYLNVNQSADDDNSKPVSLYGNEPGDDDNLEALPLFRNQPGDDNNAEPLPLYVSQSKYDEKTEKSHVILPIHEPHLESSYENKTSEDKNPKPLPLYVNEPADDDELKPLLLDGNQPEDDNNSEPLLYVNQPNSNKSKSKHSYQPEDDGDPKPLPLYVSQPANDEESKTLSSDENQPEDDNNSKPLRTYENQAAYDKNKLTSKHSEERQTAGETLPLYENLPEDDNNCVPLPLYTNEPTYHNKPKPSLDVAADNANSKPFPLNVSQPANNMESKSLSSEENQQEDNNENPTQDKSESQSVDDDKSKPLISDEDDKESKALHPYQNQSTDDLNSKLTPPVASESDGPSTLTTLSLTAPNYPTSAKPQVTKKYENIHHKSTTNPPVLTTTPCPDDTLEDQNITLSPIEQATDNVSDVPPVVTTTTTRPVEIPSKVDIIEDASNKQDDSQENSSSEDIASILDNIQTYSITTISRSNPAPPADNISDEKTVIETVVYKINKNKNKTDANQVNNGQTGTQTAMYNSSKLLNTNTDVPAESDDYLPVTTSISAQNDVNIDDTSSDNSFAPEQFETDVIVTVCSSTANDTEDDIVTINIEVSESTDDTDSDEKMLEVSIDTKNDSDDNSEATKADECKKHHINNDSRGKNVETDLANLEPTMWIRTTDQDLIDKIVDENEKEVDVIYFFEIKNEPVVEREKETTKFCNGTVLIETKEITYVHKDDPSPTIVKTTKIIQTEDYEPQRDT